MSDSTISRGLKAIHAGLEGASRHIAEINKAFAPVRESDKEPPENREIDEVGAIVGLQQDKRQVQAGAKVIEAAEEMDKAVLDILA